MAPAGVAASVRIQTVVKRRLLERYAHSGHYNENRIHKWHERQESEGESGFLDIFVKNVITHYENV